MMHRALAVLSAALLVQGDEDTTFAPWTFTPWSPGVFTPSPTEPYVPCLVHRSASACHDKREYHGRISYSCTWLSSGKCVNGLNLFHDTAEDVVEAWKIAVIVISLVIVAGVIACVVACCCCCQNQKEVVVVQQQQPAHHHQQPVGAVPPHQYPAQQYPPQQYPAQGIPVEMGAPPQGVAVEMSEPDCNPSCQPQQV